MIVGIPLAYAVPPACVRPTAFAAMGRAQVPSLLGCPTVPPFLPPTRVCVAGTGTRVHAHACFLNFSLYTRKEKEK